MIIEKLNDNPWRFAVGDSVYVAGWRQTDENGNPEPAKITAAFGAGLLGWPHYVVVDDQGTEWTLPQLMLSRSVIAL
jgi:hypothetical protein